MIDSSYLAQVLRQRDDAVRQLQVAEQELGARRRCEASVLAVLNGWGVAGAEADLMRHEVRQALMLASPDATSPGPVHECRAWDVALPPGNIAPASPEAAREIGRIYDVIRSGCGIFEGPPQAAGEATS